MEIKTTEKIIESVHVKDTIYLDKMEYDRLRDVEWVKVEDILDKLIYEKDLALSINEQFKDTQFKGISEEFYQFKLRFINKLVSELSK